MINKLSHLSPYILMNYWNLVLREFENDGMAPSKCHSTLVSLIFIFNCISKTSVIRMLKFTFDLFLLNKIIFIHKILGT